MQLVSQLTLLQPDLWDLVTGPSFQFTKPSDLPSTVSPLLFAGGRAKWLATTHGSFLVVNVGDLLLEGLFFSVFFDFLFDCFCFFWFLFFCFASFGFLASVGCLAWFSHKIALVGFFRIRLIYSKSVYFCPTQM